MLKVCGTGNIELYERGIKLWEQLIEEDANTQNGKRINPPKNKISRKKHSSSRNTLKLDAGRMF